MQLKRFNFDFLHILKDNQALSVRVASFFNERYPLGAGKAPKPHTVGSSLDKTI